MAEAGAAIELAVVNTVENDHVIVGEPFHKGRAGSSCGPRRRAPRAGSGRTVVAARQPGPDRLRQERYWLPARC
jgi:hypothetical protein